MSSLLHKNVKTGLALALAAMVSLAAGTFAAGSVTPSQEQKQAVQELENQPTPAVNALRPNTTEEQKQVEADGPRKFDSVQP